MPGLASLLIAEVVPVGRFGRFSSRSTSQLSITVTVIIVLSVHGNFSRNDEGVMS